MLLERFKFWSRQHSKVRKSVKVKRRDPIELYEPSLGSVSAVCIAIGCMVLTKMPVRCSKAKGSGGLAIVAIMDFAHFAELKNL